MYSSKKITSLSCHHFEKAWAKKLFLRIFHLQTPYHVTVVLNPAACGGKGRVRFENYCAPLLHLAGIKVSVIRTEGEGQAKDIMEVVKDCDAVLIAGGDGTLMEAVTGWMRRQTVRIGP